MTATKQQPEFDPTTWELMESAEESLLATIRGPGCVYRIYQLTDGHVCVTVTADAPVHEEREWDSSEWEYTHALVAITDEIKADS